MANANSAAGSTNLAYGLGTTTTGAVASVLGHQCQRRHDKVRFRRAGERDTHHAADADRGNAGHRPHATYDANHLLTQWQDSSISANFTSDANGFLATYQNIFGNTWTNTHSGADLTSAKTPVQAAQNKSETVAYGDASQPHIPTSYTDAGGNVWQFAHNIYGQTTQVTPPVGSPLAPSGVTYNENANSPALGYPLSATDGNGDLTTFDAYDALGDLLQVSTYPVHGNTTTKNTTTFTYDAAQRVTNVAYPDGHNAQAVYVGRNLDHTVDAAGTVFDYYLCPACDALMGLSGPSAGLWAGRMMPTTS